MPFLKIMNELLFFSHLALIALFTLTLLKLGKEALFSGLILFSLLANLFLLKQITLFGLHVTSSDLFAVGYLLILNLVQEFYGPASAKNGTLLSLLFSLLFLGFSKIHLAYQPSDFDSLHPHFNALLSPLPRLVICSLLSFTFTQFLDIAFFSYLRKKSEGKLFTLRLCISLFAAEAIDTLFFSFTALLDQVGAIDHVILFALLLKFFATLLLIPFTLFAKKIGRYDSVSF